MENKINEILSYSKFGIKLGLENIQIILNELDNPQDKIKTIHVAGTNGKGSVCEMLNATLIEAGYKVAKYSSPYLENINEMFEINRKKATDYEISREYLKVKESMDKMNIELTLYEISTCIMFLLSRDVDYLIMEVGLGGRFDATNTCKPIISVITNISLDHTNILGNNVIDIAHEKAGIIRKEIPLFTTEDNQDIINVFKKYSDNINVVNKEVEYKLDLKNFKTYVEEFEISLFGIHQVKNFLLAKEILDHLKIKKEYVKKGMKKLNHPARIEKLAPNIIFDGAHNQVAARELRKSLKGIENLTIVISILKDKDIVGVVNELKHLTNKFIFIPSKEEKRGLSIEEFKSLKIKGININYLNELKELKLEEESKHLKTVLFCGTLSNYKEIKNFLNKHLQL